MVVELTGRFARVTTGRLSMDGPDAGAMRVLYDEHAAALWRYAFRLTGDAARAEDVVQQTLSRAVRHPEVIDGTEQSPRAWLFIAARQTIVDYSGQNNATPERLLVADAIAQLPAEHRAVIRRSYYQGWTTAQIATDLGIAEGAVKARLHYALRVLHQTLQDMGVAR